MTIDYLKALGYSYTLTKDKIRKADGTPYFGHLLRVSGLVLEGGGTERAAIVGLLHDCLEDFENQREHIAKIFGEEVALLVEECSDTVTIPKPEWLKRKTDHLRSLETCHPDVLRVMLADKVDNCRSLADLAKFNPELLSRFNSTVENQVWYFTEFLMIVLKRSKEVPGTRAQISFLSEHIDCLRFTGNEDL